MSLKNLLIAVFAASAFAGAVFVAARPETHQISYAMPLKAPADTARR
jgi:hypothetical protein